MTEGIYVTVVKKLVKVGACGVVVVGGEKARTS